MSKNVVKLLSIIFITFIVMLSMSIPVHADYKDAGSKGDYTGIIDELDQEGDKSGTSQAVGTVVGAVLNVVKIVAIGLALIMLTVLAIKYMSAAPNDKAEIKKHAVVYIVGAVCLFGASGILQLIQNVSGMFNDSTKDAAGN